jgi:hypothetical protein
MAPSRFDIATEICTRLGDTDVDWLGQRELSPQVWARLGEMP